jgi:hypothetical protein
MPKFLSDSTHYNVEVKDEVHITGSSPVLKLTDTNTNADCRLHSDSSNGSMFIDADFNNESTPTKIHIKIDGEEVGYFRGDSNQVTSLRLFPLRSNNTSQGIFFGTSSSNPGVGSFTDTRVMSMDTSNTVHLYPGSGTSGALQLASAGGNVTAAADVDVTGSVKCTQNFRRTFTTVTAASNTHTCNLSLNDNFIINAAAATNTIALTVASENVGQSGTIVIKNASSGTVAFAALPSYMKTPDGASVNFVTTNSATSLISYLVVDTSTVLVNYVGNFS